VHRPRLRRRDEDPDHRQPLAGRHGHVPVELGAAADDDVGVCAAAPERPPPVDDVAVLLAAGSAGGEHPAGRHRVQIRPNRPSGDVIQKRGVEARIRTDHHAPTHGGVGGREEFDHLDLLPEGHRGTPQIRGIGMLNTPAA
jgi:hypothetical protein